MHRPKPQGGDLDTCAFPKLRKRLIELQRIDQVEIQSSAERINQLPLKQQEREYRKVAARCHERAEEMSAILKQIKAPTAEHVGLDGSKAIITLTLHSYLALMKRVLAMYEDEFQEDPATIYAQGIPPLKDRIMILEQRKQLFGTNWTVDDQGKPFLIEVEDFDNMNKRRKLYGLEPARKPVNLAKGVKKYPLGKGLAEASDQKSLAQAEYDAYSRYYLQRIWLGDV